MANNSRTLLEYLTRMNPDFAVTAEASTSAQGSGSKAKGGSGAKAQQKSRRKSSTTNSEWPIPEEIRQLDWFNWDLLHTVFDRHLKVALDTQIADLQDFRYYENSFRRICNELSLKELLLRSNNQIVQEALLKTPKDHVKHKVQMVSGDQAIFVYAKARPVNGEPDWAGIDETQKPNNILPGETKTSSACTSDDIQKCISNSREKVRDAAERVWPLRQLVSYCVSSYSRYGYIITDEELIAIRLGLSDNQDCTEDNPIEVMNWIAGSPLVEYFSVPWRNSGTSMGLTVNLTLWALHILAANNGHLQFEPYGLLKEEKLIEPHKKRKLPALESSFDSIASGTEEGPQQESYDGAQKDLQDEGDQSFGADTIVDSINEDATDEEGDPMVFSQPASFRSTEAPHTAKRKRTPPEHPLPTPESLLSGGSAVASSGARRNAQNLRTPSHSSSHNYMTRSRSRARKKKHRHTN